MYLFFDKNGTLLETVSTTALRQNSVGVNKMYIYIQDGDNPDSGKISASITGLTHRYKKSNGEIVNGNPITRPQSGIKHEDGVFEYKTLPTNRNRDLKHFVYGRKYEFFVVDIPSGRTYTVQQPIINADGEDAVEIQTITEPTIFDVAGPVLATITAVSSSSDITAVSSSSELSLERIAFTVEKSGELVDKAITGSQFAWLLSELIRIGGKVDGAYDYDKQNNRPIVNQDLLDDEQEPIEGTYYRHVGESRNGFVNGVIYYYDGEFSIVDGVTRVALNGQENVENPSFYAPTNGGVADGVNILVANGNGNAPDWQSLKLSQNGQTITLKLGDVQIGSFTIGGDDKYISDITYNSNKIVFKYADGTTKSVDLNNLVYEAGSGLEKNGNKFSLKVNNDYLYIDELRGLTVEAQDIADLAKITVNGVKDKTKNVGIYAPTQSRVANSTQECYVLMPNGTNAEPIWGKFTIDNEPQDDGFNTIFRLNGVEIGSVKHTQEIYLDSVVRDGNKIVFSYNTASGKKQVEVDLADLVNVYETGNGLDREGNTFFVKIESNSTDFLEATENGIVFKKDALPEVGDKVEALEGATINLASLPPEIGVIADDGIHYLVPEVELELTDGRLVYMQSRNAIPITAGEGVEFKKNPNNTVSINAKGGGNKIVSTSAELDNALATEKKGTLISYIGESGSGGAVGTPFEVGDEVSQVYFNMDNLFDFTKLDYSDSNLDENGILNLLEIEHSSMAVLRVNRILTSALSGDPSKTGYVYAVEITSDQSSLGIAIYYYCENYTPQELGAPLENWGWVENTIPPSGILPLEQPNQVTSVQQQEIWSSFCSKTPFTSGYNGKVYKKDTLYMVTDDGAKEVGGETIKFASEDKGKFLVVGEDGSIVAESMTIGESMLI